MDHTDYCDALELETERFADAMSLVPGDTLVATCPGWTVDDLVLHLGGVHRWAEELVRIRSHVRIPRTTLTPGEVAVTPSWLREGGLQLVATLRAADPNGEMWAWGLDQHVRFWSRRQLHETLVHRMDLELAGAIEPTANPNLACDAIDEFLSNLQKVASSETALSGRGERLGFRANDADGAWSVTLREGGFDLALMVGDHDALVEGPALDLLLMIVGRRTLSESNLDVVGASELVDIWLANSAFD